MATPVVIGVGDFKNRSQKVEDAIEPAKLMLEAIRRAIKDTNLSSTASSTLQSSIDSIAVVETWTWPYPDLAGLIAKDLGVSPRYKQVSPHGGNQPAKIFDEAARRISVGEAKVAVVTGGEALASLTACAVAKKMPPPGWTKSAENVDSVFTASNTSLLPPSLGSIHSVGVPIQVYPMYENAFRAHRGQSIQQNNEESGHLYSEFAKVAEHNPVAWNYGKTADSPEAITTVTKKNRMICFPYPLLMNAFNTINLAGACILTSTDYARELGIPESRWIYPLGGAGTKDVDNFWERPNFHSSPCISRSIDASLQVSGLTKDDIDLYDFYSCFPIVPKIACDHLGLDIKNPAKPITLLGGLTSFGGAGNNYSMHALTEMVRQLRRGDKKNGLVLANGGVLGYQHVVCLSSQPRKNGSAYPGKNPLPELLSDLPVPPIEEHPEGEATIETYTVEYNRDGSLKRGYIVGRLESNSHRFLAIDADAKTLKELSNQSEEQIGRSGWVRKDTEKEGRSLFSFERATKL
ncbi:hypothetical protein BU16DRAFT_481187 [Lophium mytilinum]|uniref:Thiolase-like protein type 1 additional C-terminal domain-containing protein n=1 Tax=Lophium mytilinum TaxID=390894 RepID=A0A6A6R3K5_9PEZI|nr:hypothetical protein BU16DRAFT_481187 [Lophium mytilinum]